HESPSSSDFSLADSATLRRNSTGVQLRGEAYPNGTAATSAEGGSVSWILVASSGAEARPRTSTSNFDGTKNGYADASTMRNGVTPTSRLSRDSLRKRGSHGKARWFPSIHS